MAKKFISASEAAEIISNKLDVKISDLVDIMAEVPTADVQEVVRCRDCKFNDNCSVQYYAMFKDIDYCSRGIKKDGDDNDKNRI